MQDLSGMLVSIAAHLSDPDTNPASDKNIFFFFLDLAKISRKTKVEFEDAWTFFKSILKF